MIHMSQVKVPVKEIIAVASKDKVLHGIIGEEEENLVKKSAAGVLKISVDEMKQFVIHRKSMDARKKKQLQYIYQVSFSCTKEKQRIQKIKRNDVKWLVDEKKAEEPCVAYPRKLSPVVAGFGPAGMFAALELAKAGLSPIVLERGMEVSRRQKQVQNFWDGKELNTECNVQFGEGGAGTFSDGKLNTLVKDNSGRNRQVLETFVSFGAPSEILYLQKPHIGTDCLSQVVASIRKEIIRLGGQIWFETRLEDMVTKDGCLKELIVTKDGKKECMPCEELILAVGHSARDTFSMLNRNGLTMEQKAFAVGVRVEHLQKMIGEHQYGDLYGKLPTADYKLTYQTQKKRGVYSFCMCPGGYVVNASSEQGRLAVNGMSYYNRDGENANSAIVVTVTPEDFGSTDVLAGVMYQRKLEEAAFAEGKGKIPVQLLGDFLRKEESTALGDVVPAMKGAYRLANVRKMLPQAIGDAIAEGMTAFGKKIAGYDREDTLLSGIESRTSSPVRMVRNESLEANIRGIYPCGEGAGYAGGITSAAMDGIKVAQMILKKERK